MKHIVRIFCILTVLTMLVVPVLADPDENTTTPESCDHTYGPWTNAGDSHTQICSQCGAVNTADHTWGGEAVTLQPTCGTEGKQTVSCSACGASKEESIAPTGAHALTDVTSAGDSGHTGTCSGCAQVLTVPHTWNSGVVDKAATCQEAGQTTFTCTGCQYTKTEVVERLTTHNWTIWLRTDDTIHARSCIFCQIKETGDHSYRESWSQDSENHYRECEACGDQTDPEPHIPGPEATATSPQLCTVCSYVLSPAADHNHDFSDRWSADEKAHWYSCSQCNEKGEYADHNFENDCDAYCSICSYPRNVTHDYSENWVSDSENHYHECSVCGDIQDKEAHTPGEPATLDSAQTCTVCGHELSPALEAHETIPNGTAGTAKKPFPVWGALLIAVVAAALIPVISFFQRD